MNELDPREVLLGIDIDELVGDDGSAKRRRRKSDDPQDDQSDLMGQLKHLRKTVEDDHDQRLRGIEINIRWLMVLVGGEVLAIVGFAVGSVAGV